MITIAIDGTSGVGKSSLADDLAARLGCVHLDTGAMFRGIGVYCIDNGIDINDEKAVSEALKDINEEIIYKDGAQYVIVNGVDQTGRLRTEDVSKAASVTSQYPAVRNKVLELEREIARRENCIMDGRDIGTVVLPDATLKLFLTASGEVRADRRYRQLKAADKLNGADYESILADIKERDYRDSHRGIAPLKKADDAFEVESSDMTIEEVKDCIEKLLQQKLQASASE